MEAKRSQKCKGSVWEVSEGGRQVTIVVLMLLRKQQVVTTLKYGGKLTYSSSIHLQQCMTIPSRQGKIVSHNSRINERTLGFPIWMANYFSFLFFLIFDRETRNNFSHLCFVIYEGAHVYFWNKTFHRQYWMLDFSLEVSDCEEVFIGCHLGWKVYWKLCDFLSNVTKKCIGFPSPDDHNCEVRNLLGKVECHCCSRSEITRSWKAATTSKLHVDE